MNRRISKIYVIVEEGRVILADTNLKDIQEDLSKSAPDITYTMLYNSFRDSDYFERTSKSNGKVYSFQVIHNKDYQP